MGVAPLAAQYSDPLTAALAKLDQSSRFTVEVVMDSARSVGLPDMPLRSRVLEGVQKKQSAGRIVESVRKKFSFLRTARTVLGQVGNEELDAASAVLENGGKPTQLQSFKARQKGREALEAFAVWTDLLNRGIPGEEASSAISKLWQEGADDATFHSLWNNVQADISQGLNPVAALQNRVRETPARTATPKSTPPEGQQENQRSE
ncbi:MAG: hypothetical protein ACREPM_03360 [Gemmatimonadaceae bacterium]